MCECVLNGVPLHVDDPPFIRAGSVATIVFWKVLQYFWCVWAGWLVLRCVCLNFAARRFCGRTEINSVECTTPKNLTLPDDSLIQSRSPNNVQTFLWLNQPNFFGYRDGSHCKYSASVVVRKKRFCVLELQFIFMRRFLLYVTHTKNTRKVFFRLVLQSDQSTIAFFVRL